MANVDLVYKKIKKQNGEQFARIMRDAVLLDVPDILPMLEFAGNNPTDAKMLVPLIRYLVLENQRKTEKHKTAKTEKNPIELLADAGYNAFVVKTEKQKNSIKKYFRQYEGLCTFGDASRHEKYYMIHAVKHDADKIQPSLTPRRQDEYGTSVISIQIAKSGGFISIKNRYNHSVSNPDATFDNNPDNIIPGLSDSLKWYFDVDFSVINKSDMPDKCIFAYNRFIKYNYETNNVYFGPDFYFMDGHVEKIDKDYEIMLGRFILDTGTGMIQNPSGVDSELYSALVDEFFEKKITIKTDATDKETKIVYADGVDIVHVKNGVMQKLKLPHLEKCGNYFLENEADLTEVRLPNLKKCGDYFMCELSNLFKSNKNLSVVDLPKLQKCGNHFLEYVNNKKLLSIDLPKLKRCGYGFMTENRYLQEINLPELEECGADFLYNNESVRRIDFPKLVRVGDGFLYHNNVAEYVNLPKLKLSKKNIESNLVITRSGALMKFYRDYAKNYKNVFLRAIDKLKTKNMNPKLQKAPDSKSR